MFKSEERSFKNEKEEEEKKQLLLENPKFFWPKEGKKGQTSCCF